MCTRFLQIEVRQEDCCRRLDSNTPRLAFVKGITGAVTKPIVPALKNRRLVKDQFLH